MAATPYTLYYYPMSYYSKKALLTLYHKDIDFKHVLIDIYGKENTNSEFLNINPRGKVPAIKHGDTIVTESEKIIDYIDTHCVQGPPLVPDLTTAHGQEVNQFRKLIDDVEIEYMTFGIIANPELSTTGCAMQRLVTPARLRKTIQGKITEAIEKAETEPHLRDFWLDKQQFQEAKVAFIFNKPAVARLLDDIELVFDKLEEQLHKHNGEPSSSMDNLWMVGNTFTVADVLLSIFFDRLELLGIMERYATDSKRPLCRSYHQRLFARQAFKKMKSRQKYMAIILGKQFFKCALPVVAKVASVAAFVGVTAYLFKKYDVLDRVQEHFQ